MTFVEDCDKKHYNGTINITGRIMLSQFFGQKTRIGGKDVLGVSDADTIKLTLTPESIKFRKTNDSAWQDNLRLYDDAYYYDEETGKRIMVMGRDIANSQFIKTRLEGLDAPELHYKANKGNTFLYDNQFSLFKSLNEVFDFRQPYGARAASELVKLLYDYSSGDSDQKYVKAYAVSSVDSPSELFDKYGRAVCDIFVYKDKEENSINLNHWLVQNGWAFPDFYDSMSNEEITTLRNMGNEAANEKKRYEALYVE